MKPLSNRLHAFLITASSSLVFISIASAQTWDGGGADNKWSTDLNWSTDVAPVSGATLTFAGTTQRTNSNDLAEDTVIGDINFTNNSGGVASQFIISGNRITLGGNMTTTAATGTTFTDIISTPINLNGNRTITTNANHSISLNGIISETGGAFGLIKAGAAALTLAANNTYTGVTAINVGAIRLQHNNGFGSTVGNTTIAATGSDTTGGRIALIGSVNTPENITITGTTEAGGFNSAIDGAAGTVSGNITLANPGNAGIRLGAFTAAGNILQTGTARILYLTGTTVNNPISNGGATLGILNGVATLKGVSGSGIGITQIAQNGTLKLGVTNALNTSNELSVGAFGNATDTNTFDLASFNQTVRGLEGGTGTRRVINSVESTTSILTVGNGSTSSNTYAFSGTILNNNGTGGTVALTKIGNGSQTISGTSNSYSGGTTHSGGILVAGSNSAFGTGDITFSGTANGLVLNNGISIANNITVGTHTGLLGAGLMRVAANGTATLSGTITINNSPSAGGHFGTLAASSGTLNVTGIINSTVPVTHRNGTLVISGGGSYTQFITNQGTTRLGANNGLATNATLTLGSSGAANFDLAGFNQTLVGITRALPTNTTLVGNSSTASSSTLTTTGTSTFSGIIQDILGTGNKTTALTVNGGSLTLSGANTYTGATTVSSGTLNLGANNAIADASNVVIGAGTLNVNTFTDSVGTLTVTGTATVNLGTGAALSFADSKAVDWTGGSLNVTGTLGATSIRFGDSADDLTSAQLALISVNGSGAGTYALDSNGYLVAAGSATPYQTWASEKGLTVANQANNLDPDGDGNNNLAEFAFNGNPLSGSDNGKVFMLTADSDVDGDTTNELVLTVAVRTGTPVFTGSPTPSAAHPTDGITYSVEGSLDLNGFPASVTVVPTAVTTGLPAAGAGMNIGALVSTVPMVFPARASSVRR